LFKLLVRPSRKMRISHRHKFIQLSNRRCGSHSLRQWLTPYSDILSSRRNPYFHHIKAEKLQTHFQERNWDWDSYFSFVTIRNPWDRVVSHYTYALHNNKSHWNSLVAISKNFTDFIRNSDVQKKFYEQSRIPYSINGSLLVNRVFNVETMTLSLPEELRKRRIPVDGEFLQLSRTDHLHYSQYYTDETAEIVAQIFQDDIRFGGYEYSSL
jgi:hypothetical protein